VVSILTNCSSPNRTSAVIKEKRIISLSPHITEIIYALGADKDLVAVTSYCQYPLQAREKEKIGGLFDPNIEKIVNLSPTHLFGIPAHFKLNQDLTRFNLHVLMLPDETVSDVFNTIDTLGRILGYENQARNIITNIRNELQQLHDKNKQHQPVTAILVIGKEPGSLQNLMLAGSNTLLNELWTLVGGINSFADLPVRYSAVNLESIIQRNPQVIIQFDTNRPGGIYIGEQESSWQVLKDIAAVKNRNIYTIGGDYVFIPGPRLILLAQNFSTLINQLAGE